MKSRGSQGPQMPIAGVRHILPGRPELWHNLAGGYSWLKASRTPQTPLHPPPPWLTFLCVVPQSVLCFSSCQLTDFNLPIEMFPARFALIVDMGGSRSRSASSRPGRSQSFRPCGGQDACNGPRLFPTQPTRRHLGSRQPRGLVPHRLRFAGRTAGRFQRLSVHLCRAGIHGQGREHRRFRLWRRNVRCIRGPVETTRRPGWRGHRS